MEDPRDGIGRQHIRLTTNELLNSGERLKRGVGDRERRFDNLCGKSSSYSIRYKVKCTSSFDCIELRL